MMHITFPFPFFICLSFLFTPVLSLRLSYKDSINALAYGNVKLQGTGKGEVWFNVTGFASDKLPHIQENIGILSLDNADSLNVIAGLAQAAASAQMWGDVVFLFNAFGMNGHGDYITVSSDEMRIGLLQAVDGGEGSPNMDLIDLYVSTSSSIHLANAFNALKTTSSRAQNRTSIKTREEPDCNNSHLANRAACKSLIDNLHVDFTLRTGGPRDICKGGCCVSWSANATFQVRELWTAANTCYNACGEVKVSCVIGGVNLGGTWLDQCLSNRAKGCK